MKAAALKAIIHLDTLLSTQTWPLGVETQVAKLLASNVKLATAVRGVPTAPALVTAAQGETFFTIVDRSHVLGVAVRTQLGLP